MLCSCTVAQSSARTLHSSPCTGAVPVVATVMTCPFPRVDDRGRRYVRRRRAGSGRSPILAGATTHVARCPHGGGARRGAELAEDRRHVVLDGALGQVQRTGDVGVGAA